MSGMQAEAGFCCPITMTFAAVPALGDFGSEWVPRLVSQCVRRLAAARVTKDGATCGMAMTEKQGGSDVRANTTVATPLGVDGEYTLVGHKWFCSRADVRRVPDAGADRRGPAHPTCFVLPRFLPDGSKNEGFQLQRLKDKLGNKSNASSEVEYRGAWAQRLGDPGRGVPTIIEMVNHTRLDCVIGTAAGMRAAVARATWHAEHRVAFGKRAGRAAADAATCSPTWRSRPRRRPCWRCASRARTTIPRRTTSAAWRRRWRSTSSASARRTTPTRRSRRTAATATSRRAGCRASTARRRCRRSGRARGT